MRSREHISLLSIFVFCLIGSNAIGQNQSVLDFTVKELNGDTIELRDRLDPNANYIIDAMAFWCAPCIRSIEKFNYHKNYYKERFNVDIILIEDDHWDDLEYVEQEMEDFGWDVDIVVSNDQFSSAGINGIPRYFFKGVASDTVERIYGGLERFMLERLDSISFAPILDSDFKQVIATEDCDESKVDKVNSNEKLIVNGHTYVNINDRFFRERMQNGDVVRLNLETMKEEAYIKYSAALCSRVWLVDFEGDSLLVKILDRYQQDSILHVVTDQMVVNECDGSVIPFEFVQDIGTNAGFEFDIENGQIVSRLICHENDEGFIYMDSELGVNCLTLSNQVPKIEQLNVQIFPNPVRSELSINLNFEGEKKIEIFTTEGKRIISKSTDQNEISIQFPDPVMSAFFVVKISTRYGVYTKKVIRVTD